MHSTETPAERASMDEQLILDRYRLIERLASGGSAEVWRAHDEQLDRPVAVKRLHPHLMPDQASRSRLAAEARAAAGLSHPVIVGIYDVDATGDSPALVMELVEGESLGARIARDGPLPEREAVAISADVAEALFHAHQRGVIHRDVKPGNVLLATDGRVRLVDFGIAHSLAKSAERITVTGTVIGTLHAMSPEQLADGPITPRTDLYGLGVVLAEALTGRQPYPASSPVALADAQRAGLPSLEGIEPALAAVIASCLAYDPANRPLHAGALAAALRDWLAGDPAAALAMAPPPRADADTSAMTQPMRAVAPVTAAPADRVPPPSRSRRGLLLLAAIVGLLLVAVVAVAALGAGKDAVGTEPTPTPLATPLPSLAPDWLAGLVEKVRKECGADLAAQAEAEMASMGEDEAKDYADGLARECKRGNGGGNGNGNGRGNDD